MRLPDRTTLVFTASGLVGTGRMRSTVSRVTIIVTENSIRSN